MQGRAITAITIGTDGKVVDVKTLSAHPVFASYALPALKQWKFKPAQKEKTVEVTFSFEFVDVNAGSEGETYISAELPKVVHIATGFHPIETTVSQSKRLEDHGNPGQTILRIGSGPQIKPGRSQKSLKILILAQGYLQHLSNRTGNRVRSYAAKLPSQRGNT